jgi:hypothetical protein
MRPDTLSLVLLARKVVAAAITADAAVNNVNARQ